jgi:hypothetical protein
MGYADNMKSANDQTRAELDQALNAGSNCPAPIIPQAMANASKRIMINQEESAEFQEKMWGRQSAADERQTAILECVQKIEKNGNGAKNTIKLGKLEIAGAADFMKLALAAIMVVILAYIVAAMHGALPWVKLGGQTNDEVLPPADRGSVIHPIPE